MAGPRAQTAFFRSAKARSSPSAWHRAWQEDMLIRPHGSRSASGRFSAGRGSDRRHRHRAPAPSCCPFPGPGEPAGRRPSNRGTALPAPQPRVPGEGAPRALRPNPGGALRLPQFALPRRRHACRPSLLLPAMGAKRGAGAQGVAAQCRRPARRTERRADAGRGRHQTSWARRGTPGRGKAASVSHTEMRARDSGFAAASAPGRG